MSAVRKKPGCCVRGRRSCPVTGGCAPLVICGSCVLWSQLEPLLPGKQRARLLWAAGHCVPSTSQCIPWSSADFYLRHLVNIHCWWLNIELKANSTITHARTKLFEHMHFLCEAHHVLSISALLLKAILNWNRQQNHRKAKSTALNRPRKAAHSQCKSWNRRSAACPPQLGCWSCRAHAQIFHPSVRVHRWPWEHQGYWFGGYK